MRLAADFRQEAREALRGKWPMAILIGLVAMLLGGSEKGGAEIKFNYDTSAGFSTTFNFAGQKIYSTGCGIDPKWSGLLIGGAIYLIVIALILAAVYFILGSAVGVGYAEYNLRLIDHAEGGFDTLFAYLPDWKTTALTRLYKSLYVLVGTLLLVVPGNYHGLHLRDDGLHFSRASGYGAGRGDEGFKVDDGGQPLAAFLPAIQFCRLDTAVHADVWHRQPCAATLPGGGARRILPRDQRAVKEKMSCPAL